MPGRDDARVRLFAFDLTGHAAAGDPAAAELLHDRLWGAGAAGLWEVDATTLRAGVDDDDAEAFAAVVADLSPVDVTEAEAVELATRRLTVPFGDRELDVVVPPTVFGDGLHPTTATCLLTLLRLGEGEVLGPGTRVLDVGCGTGVLAVAAATTGAHVDGIDIEVAAVDATLANASSNGVRVDATTTPLGLVESLYDVVVANITAGSITPLLDDLVRVTMGGGRLVVSGLLETQWPGVRDAVGGRVISTVVRDGWVTAEILMRR